MCDTPMSTIEALIRDAIALAGSEQKLGEACGFSQHAIWWSKTNGKCSAELAAAIHRATEGKVSKHNLRPDLFGAAPAPSEVAA
jgi:DNA-binding transcriptional regulator YdaS (Cro superfamily)